MTRPVLLTTLFLLLLTTLPSPLHGVSGEIRIKVKLNALIVPSIDFNETPLADALEFLRQKSDELDAESFGINIVVASEVDPSAPINSLALRNTPLSAVLGYVCEMTGNKYRVDRNAVIIYRPKAKTTEADTTSTPPPAKPAPRKPHPASFQVRAKLESIILPHIDLYDAPISEVIEFLRAKSTELDVLETNPAQKGLNFVITGTLPEPEPTVTLKLNEVPLSDVLRYVAGLTGMTYDVSPHAITFRP